VFYQETYDLKMVLDAISDTLITDNDIEKIMSQSLHVITDAIRPSYAFLAVFDNEDRIYRTLNVDISFDEQTVIQLLAYSKTTKDNPIMRDDFLEKKLPEYFTTNDLSLVVRLGERDNPVGLLLFGVKQNGRTYTGDDIALLRISSTNIGIALDNAKKYEQISHFAETMHEEVLKATAKLRNANEKLKTLDALKDDFISMASHQLRTPAASVHEALQMLNHPMMPLSKTDRARLEELAEASSEHLVTVVSDMLSIARIQSGHFTVNKSPTILQNLVEKVLKQTSVLAEQKDIKIEQKLPSEPISVHVDVAKMNEAFSNYIENAIKYSPEKTTVTISLQTDKNKVKFEIEDMGMGVPEDERDGLFTKFYRAKNARNEQPDGNGIGLFVVKSIANGHDGDVYYEPLPSGGSKFGFWIPVK
jgi:K+-sensing histidine kinase KdpD